MMQGNRRNFLTIFTKAVGMCALGLGLKPSSYALSASGGYQAPAAEFKKGKAALTAGQWALVIDTRKFKSAADLEPIIEACHQTHNVPDLLDQDHPEYQPVNFRHRINWIWEEEFKHAFPGQDNKFINDRIKHLPFPVLCNHCEDPPCVRACPTKATFKREDGIVLMDFHRCIGCRFCMAACPYGSRSFNFRDPRPFIKHKNPQFPTRMKGVVEKCNFCAERLAVGKVPACVEVSKGAIIFGDLEDPQSDVVNVLKSNYSIRRKPGLGTGPAVYYIV